MYRWYDIYGNKQHSLKLFLRIVSFTIFFKIKIN